MRDLTSAESNGSLDLVALIQKLDYVAVFHLIVMLINVSAEPYFLNIDNLLVLTGFLLFLLLLITELAIVHDAAYRWFGCRRDVHQIQIEINCKLQGIPDRFNTDLLALCSD
ncbi:hypothetical protein D3C78_1577310 [compost metagenome]